jgi:3-dehydrosphinganine reductase
MQTTASSELIIGVSVTGAILFLLTAWRLISNRLNRFDLLNKVVVITGGSSGIGKAVAARCLAAGAHVAILARKLPLLESARAELIAGETKRRAHVKDTTTPFPRVTIHACDVAIDSSTQKAFKEIAAAHSNRIDAVVASAGISCPRRFEDTDVEEFESVLRTNVTGARNSVFHALPYMSKRIGDGSSGGRIVLVSSMAGQVGLYGYTAYSSSKFALAGLAQSLSMELYTRNVLVSLCYPPDTDTPLLALENETKPEITKKLSESAAIVSPDIVGRGIVEGMVDFDPHISFGFDGWMLSTLTAGMSPAHSWLQTALEVFSMGLWRVVSLIVVGGFYSTVRGLDTLSNASSTGTTNSVAAKGKGTAVEEKKQA